MWYINIAGRIFGLVTKHACDRHTDGQTDGQTDRIITTPKTALAYTRGNDNENKYICALW